MKTAGSFPFGGRPTGRGGAAITFCRARQKAVVKRPDPFRFDRLKPEPAQGLRHESVVTPACYERRVRRWITNEAYLDRRNPFVCVTSFALRACRRWDRAPDGKGGAPVSKLKQVAVFRKRISCAPREPSVIDPK